MAAKLECEVEVEGTADIIVGGEGEIDSRRPTNVPRHVREATVSKNSKAGSTLTLPVLQVLPIICLLRNKQFGDLNRHIVLDLRISDGKIIGFDRFWCKSQL
jgi:hypothetical protein